MDAFLARQPIFDTDLRVYGYEILHRSCRNLTFDDSDGTLATMQVVANALLSFGPARVLSGKRGFINFNTELLLSDFALVLPAKSFVIEILESVPPDDTVIEACRFLRSRGFSLALDDVVSSDRPSAFGDLANIIKVDFQNTTGEERELLVQEHGKNGVRMLAEKIETQEEFTVARSQGFSYFQGYFFARPAILETRVVPGSKLNILRILAEIQRREVDFEELERTLKPEIQLCYRLLQYVNSWAFGSRARIKTIHQTLVLLGEKELRRWLSLAALPLLACDKPDELVETAVLRGRLCELLAPLAGFDRRSAELFLMGMFSLLDAMVGRPLDELLGELCFASDLRDTLLGKLPPENSLVQVFSLVRACERAEWDAVSESARHLGIPCAVVADLYLEAVNWCSQIFHAEAQPEPRRRAEKTRVPCGR